MLSKITFSVILLSAVLVLTSFYENDKEEQGEVLSYTLVIDNVKPQIKKELSLRLDNIDNVEYYIEVESSKRRKIEIFSGHQLTASKGNIEGRTQKFNGIFNADSREKILDFSQKGKRNTYIIKKIRLQITSSSEKPVVTLNNVIAGRRRTLMELSERIELPKDLPKEEFNKLLKNHSTNITGTIIQTQQNILQIAHDASDVNVEIAGQALLQYPCVEENTDFSVNVLDSSTDEGFIDKIRKALKANRAVTGSINQLTFAALRPIPEKEEIVATPKPTIENEISENTGEKIINIPEQELVVALGNTYTLDTTKIDEIKGAYVIDMLSATGDKCNDSCQIKILNCSGCKATRRTDDSKSIDFTYDSKFIDNGEAIKIEYSWISGNGVETLPAPLYIDVPQPPKNISEGVTPIILNTSISAISDYAQNSEGGTNMGSRYMRKNGYTLDCEQNLLLVLASTFPIDTQHMRILINEKAQYLSGYNSEKLNNEVLSKLKTEQGQTLSQYQTITEGNYYDVEDFTLQLFDDYEKASEYKKGKGEKGTFDTHHHSLIDSPNDVSNKRGHYAFTILKPKKICKDNIGKEINIYITFENNNLYTPINMYAYTVGIKPETI